VRDVKRYLEYIRGQARSRFDAGMDPRQAADDIDLGDFADWTGVERIVQNVDELYREFDPSRPAVSKIEIFQGMARWAKRHGRSAGVLA
jgi:hypothetical protein